MSDSRSPSSSTNNHLHNLSSLPASASTNLRNTTTATTPKQEPAEYTTEQLTVHLEPQVQVPESSSHQHHRRHHHEEGPSAAAAVEETDEQEPMAKRIRRMSPAGPGRLDSHSSPSSEDSQDDMADNEMDMRMLDRRPEPLSSPPTSAPPKKKRTRTLTTPHQSAVLHALLAQSRFPTTAMREEVGRSIGLSARKVQIWFQNQRQKSRRPRSQSDTPSHPPQYGPFPHIGDSHSHGMHGYDDHASSRMPYTPSQPSRGGPPELSPTLLGPGMPGAPVYPPPPDAYRHAGPPPSMPHRDHHHPLHQHQHQQQPQQQHHHQQQQQVAARPPPLHRALSPPPYRSPRMYPHPGVRPATSQSTSWREIDPSRTLPPLVSLRPSSSSYAGRRIHPPSASGTSHAHAHPHALSLSHPHPHPAHQHHYAPTTGPILPPPRSLSPEPMFAHQLPPDPAPRASMHLPPPFTLEPSPQWDESAFSAVPRPSSSAWSRPGSTRSARGRSTSPIAIRRESLMSLGGGGSGGGGVGISGAASHSELGGSSGATSTAAASASAGARPTSESSSSSAYYHADREREHGMSTSASASTSVLQHHPPSSSPLASSPPSRAGRYDPIRSTFVAYSTTPPVRSPVHSEPGGASTSAAVAIAAAAEPRPLSPSPPPRHGDEDEDED